MSIENDPGFWKQIGGWMWAILALPMASMWRKVEGAASREEIKELERRMDEHTIRRDTFDAHAVSDDKRMHEIGEEISNLRGNQAKIFDQMREMEAAATKRHSEMVTLIYTRTEK
jgi:hypothetical protein